MTKQLLGAGVLAVLMGSTALAADLPAPMSMPEMPAPASTAYDWTGFYLGLHGGYAWGESDVELSEDALGELGETSIDLDGWFAGVQGGYNYQMGHFVVGIEADASWSDINGSSSEDGDIGGPVTYNSDLSLDWLATVRLRGGFALDRALIYGTGGFAFAQMNYEYDITDAGDVELISGDIDENLTGWTVGGGVEYAATENFTVKLEYLYTDLGDFDDSTTIVADPNIPDGTYSIDGDVTFHTVKLGANYKF
jgi:outer membrane immunogenic protein